MRGSALLLLTACLPAVTLVAGEQALFLSRSQVSLTTGGNSATMGKQIWEQQATDFAWKEGEGVFSPNDLVGLGRPGAGVANDAGDLLLVPYSKYDFEEKKNKKSIFIAPIEDLTFKPLEIPLEKGGEAFWLDKRTIGHVFEGENKTLSFYSIDIKFSSPSSITSPDSPTFIGTFPTASAANFVYSPEAKRLVFSDEVYEDGDLTTVNEQDKEWDERGNTAFVYDAPYVRHWDRYVGPKKSALFSVPFSQRLDGKWVLEPEWTNLLKGTGHSSPVAPFGGTDDFSVSKTHVVYTAKDPDLPEALHTKQNIYTVDITGASPPREITMGKHGATHAPVFSTSGTKVAWLQQDEDGNEADKTKVVMYDLTSHVWTAVLMSWDRSPEAVVFSKDDRMLYLTAGDEGRTKLFSYPLFMMPVPSDDDNGKPRDPVALTSTGAASGIQALPDGRILFSRSSFTSPNNVFVVSGSAADPTNPPVVTQLTNFTSDDFESKFLADGEEFWFKGALDRDVQGWIFKPKGFEKGEDKAWPVALLIHGGPEDAWKDQWSTRWNPNVFVNQGFVVVMINSTGSSTFGQEFSSGIKNDWGGKPFVDLKNGWDYMLAEYPEIDADRAVAAGASWGGFAVNYIQGHPELGFHFKAMFCHDGVFDIAYLGHSTDELFFFNYEWGGRPWDKETKELIDKYSPSQFVDKWSIPQLIVHGSKDYRLAETDSIAAFHALQQLGIPSRLVIFPDENHWVLNHENSLKWHHEVFRWFDQWVGTTKAP